jgi:heptosyltransferase-3
MVKENFGGLLKADPAIDGIFEVKKYGGSLFNQAAAQASFLKNLRTQRFDLVVDLRLGDRGAFMAFATGAQLRVTVHHPEGVPFWRNSLFTHGVKPGPPVHLRGATDQSLGILRELGIDSDDIIPKLWVSAAVKKRVVDILGRKQVDPSTPWISLNPYSRWSYKEWDDHKWIEIIDWLWQDFAIPIVIIGSPEEKTRAETLVEHCQGRAFNFAGETTLEELAGLLRFSRLHVGVDSAGPHIAAATGVPTITIYGPSDWKDWAPIGNKHRVILPDMDCVPCRNKGCENRDWSRCLDELTVEQVKHVIRGAVEEQF